MGTYRRVLDTSSRHEKQDIFSSIAIYKRPTIWASHSRIHYAAARLTLSKWAPRKHSWKLFSLLSCMASSGNTSLDDRCSPVTPLFHITIVKINRFGYAWCEMLIHKQIWNAIKRDHLAITLYSHNKWKYIFKSNATRTRSMKRSFAYRWPISISY